MIFPVVLVSSACPHGIAEIFVEFLVPTMYVKNQSGLSLRF